MSFRRFEEPGAIKKYIYALSTGRSLETGMPSYARRYTVFAVFLVIFCIFLFVFQSQANTGLTQRFAEANRTPQSEVVLINEELGQILANAPTAVPAAPGATVYVPLAPLPQLNPNNYRLVSPKGILPEHVWTGRVAFENNLYFAALRPEPNVNFEPTAIILPGDTLGIVEEFGEWYKVEIFYTVTGDESLVGAQGYVLKWIIDGEGAPLSPTPVPATPVPATPIPATSVPVQQETQEVAPTTDTGTAPTIAPLPTEQPVEPTADPGQVAPTPLPEAPTAAPVQETPFTGRVDNPLAADVPCSTEFASTISGWVAQNSAPVSGAVVTVTSEGGQVFEAITDSSGQFSIPGLGCSNWTVQVVGQPSTPFFARVDGAATTNVTVFISRST